MMRQEYIYRDYLAFKLGGETEVYLPNTTEKIDVLTKTHVIEVKYAHRNKLRMIWAQLEGYWEEIEKIRPSSLKDSEDPSKSIPRIPQIFLIWSADRPERNRERLKYERQYEKFKGKFDLLPGIIERDITPIYKIADLEFTSRDEIERHLTQIKIDFLAADYLCDRHREFIDCLVKAYRLVHRKRPFTYVVRPIDLFGNKMSVFCTTEQGGNISLEKCVSAFLMKAHHDLVVQPVTIDESPTGVGVILHNIGKQEAPMHLPHSSGGGTRYLSKLTPYFERQYSKEIDHRLIMRGFPFFEGLPREKFGILFRIEPDGSALVQSEVRPDWSNCLPATHFQTKEFELPKFEVGDRLRFRLSFNSIARHKGRDRKVDPTEWLTRHPFGADLDVRSIDTEVITDISKGHRILVHRATCEGVCTVTDADVLRHAIANGVGRARAYGCGLLSVCR